MHFFIKSFKNLLICKTINTNSVQVYLIITKDILTKNIVFDGEDVF